MANGDRTLSITIVATSEKAQKELAKLSTSAEAMGLRVGAAGEKVAKAGEHTEAYGARTGKAFDVVQTALSSVGASLGPVGELLESFSGSFEHVTENASKMHKGLQVAGAALTAIGGIVAAEAAQDEAATAQLKNAVENSGKSWEGYGEELEKAARAQAKHGHSAKDATEALTLLTTATKDPEQAMRELSVASDVAARKHMHLADAAALLSSVHAGSSKALRQLGIDAKGLVNSEAELATAHRETTAAAAEMGRATSALSDFEARLQAQEAAGQEAHNARVQAAQDKLTAAEQHLTDVTQRNAQARAQAQEAADQRVADSSQKLTDARQRVADVEQSIHEATQLTLQDSFDLRDANESLSDVQQQIADGQLSGAEAAKALRDAQQKLSDTQQVQAEKTQASTAQQEQLRKAQQDAAKAAQDHTAALDKQKGAGAETTAQHVAQRDAVSSVADAHDAVAKAQASGSGGPSLAQLQEEKKLRDAVTKAQHDQAKAATDLAKAQADQTANGPKIKAYIDEIGRTFKGAAKAQDDTFLGTIRSATASVQNLFAGLGTSVGLELVAAGAAMDIFLALSKVKIFTFGAEVVAAEEGVADASIAAGAATEIGLGPVLLAVAAIGVAAYELYKHWHAIWGAIKDVVSEGVHFVKEHLDWVIAVAFGPLGIAFNLVRKHWDDIWGAIKSSASGLGKFFTGVFSGLANIVLAPWRLIESGVNGMIKGLNGIKIHIPSVLGIGGFDWNGLGLPLLPPIPSFADGGLVPGRDGDPVLIKAHGGERILNRGQQAAQWGGGGQLVKIEVNITGALITDRQAAEKVGMMVADGVHTALLKKQERQPLNFTGRRQ